MKGDRVIPFGRDVEEMQRNLSRLKGGGGGGTSDGMDDVWKKSVDDQLKRGADNFRALLASLVAVAVAIIGMLIGLYVFTGNKTDAIAKDISAIRVDQATHRGEMREMNAQLIGRLDRIADRLPVKPE